LGLYLVKNIIERYGGVMVFQSDYQQGSTFGFDIPMSDHDMPTQTVSGNVVIG
jgi:signal transduction histidine kinase